MSFPRGQSHPHTFIPYLGTEQGSFNGLGFCGASGARAYDGKTGALFIADGVAGVVKPEGGREPNVKDE